MKKQKIKIPQGIEVFSPEENKKIKGEQLVPLTTYWIRRIRQGDVQMVSETNSTSKKEV